jgi:hypothetical protein
MTRETCNLLCFLQEIKSIFQKTVCNLIPVKQKVLSANKDLENKQQKMLITLYCVNNCLTVYFPYLFKKILLKGSPGIAPSEGEPCDHEVMGSSRGNSLLQK